METGKSAIITGGTQGIGRAIAEKLLAEGFNVSVCARNATELQALKKSWAEQYPASAVCIYPADLSNPRAAKAFGNAALNCFGAPDILVNNAGIFEPGTLAAEPEGQLERLMAVNLYSAYHLTRTLLPAMQEKTGGHIFNLCSVASLKAYPNGGSYSISKYALLGFSDNLREELRETGIRVTSLCPGATWSRSWSTSGIAPERIMKSEDVAAMLWAAYSLSPQACLETVVMRPQLGDL